MYFNTGQYPALHGMEKKERNLLVAAAMERHGKKAGRRFWIAMTTLLLNAAIFGWFAADIGLPNGTGLIGAMFAALLFYGYLLWEINGDIFTAVSKYTNERL